MGGDFNPSAEAENQGKGPVNSPSNNPLTLQGAIGCLRLRWLLGGPLLGLEPHPICN